MHSVLSCRPTSRPAGPFLNTRSRMHFMRLFRLKCGIAAHDDCVDQLLEAGSRILESTHNAEETPALTRYLEV